MRDIAARAGVSSMSVSRALRGHSGVSQETRAQVMAAVKELGYQPNEFARQLRTGGPTHLIALIVSHLSNPFYAMLAVGVERIAAEHGARVLIMSTHSDLATEREVVEDLSRRRVDGVIIVPATPDHRHLAGLGGPTTPVVFATAPPNGIDASAVLVDDFGGMHRLCSHLLADGHRSIGLLGLNRAMWTGSERFRGYAAAHAEAGIPVDTQLITEHAGDIGWAIQETRRLLELPSPPTAIIAANNLMTVGALRATQAVASEAVVTGFDDIPMADLFRMPLTLVRFDAERIGARSAELLFHSHADRDDPSSRTRAKPVRDVLPTKLVHYGATDDRRGT
ncbi:MAG TPA: LacI family DNA-binding transcriptional regulator [Microlunatus sp.]